ncbi:MAG: flagellar basal body P-ring formation chaperone FlgA [Spirochaetota bacterium]
MHKFAEKVLQTCLLFFLPSSAYSLPKDTLLLKTRVFLYQDKVYLRDIARFSSSKPNLAILARPKQPVYLEKSDLKLLLQKTQLANDKVVGRQCLLVPMDRKVEAQELHDSLQKEILHKTKLNIGDFRLRYIGKDVHLPSQGVAFRWGHFARKLTPGRRIFSLDLYWKKRKIFSERLLFVMERKIKAVTASQNIRKGDTLLENKNYQLKTLFTLEKQKYLLSKNVDGYTALASIEAGELIRPKQIRQLYAVQRGSLVDIFYIKGNLFIRGRGKAKSSGNVGDNVQVLGHSRKKTITAEVIAPGKVQIK